MAAKTVIQVRRDTAANWTSVNPTLAAGEIGFETDTSKFKIGNGSTAWSSLAYQNASGPQGATGAQGTQGAGVPVGGTTGQFLIKNSATNYDTVWLATPLPIANGGTNSTATATNGGVGYGTGTAHAYTAAGTSGQVLTSSGAGAPSWSSTPSKLPWGRVASASTTTQTNVSGLTDLTNLTCAAYTFSTSRWYRITVTLQAAQFLASQGNTLYPYIYDSTAGVKLFDLPLQAVLSTDTQGYSASVVTSSLSGSKTIQAAASVSGGTIAVGNGTVSMSIIVEDIGPV